MLSPEDFTFCCYPLLSSSYLNFLPQYFFYFIVKAVRCSSPELKIQHHTIAQILYRLLS